MEQPAFKLAAVGDIMLMTTRDAGVPGVELLVPVEERDAVRSAIIGAGAVQVGDATVDRDGVPLQAAAGGNGQGEAYNDCVSQCQIQNPAPAKLRGPQESEGSWQPIHRR